MQLKRFQRPLVVYGMVFLAVLLLHGIGHRYGLPYVEHYDEARLFYNAAIQRGAADGMVDLPGYPPLLLWLYAFVQPLGERISQRPAELDMGVGIGIMRAAAVLANAVSAVLLVWCGRRITGGWAAGLLAACAWAIAPDTLYNTVIALTEPYLVLTSLLALALALHAIFARSHRAAVWSVVAALVGVLFKYTAFPALGFGVGAALWLLYTERRGGLTLAAQILLIACTAALLFSVAGAGQLVSSEHGEAVTLTQQGGARLGDSAMWTLVIQSAAGQVRLGWPVLAAAALTGSLIFVRRDAQLRLIWLALLGYIGFGLALAVMYITYTEGIYRYVAPLSPFMSLLASLALRELVATISGGSASGRFWAAGVGGLLLMAALWLLPMLPITLSIVQERTRLDTRAALADWSLPVLTTPYQTILQDSRDVRVFVRDRAGYRGLWHFQKWEDALSKPPAAWVSEGVSWLMATEATQTRLTQTEEGRAWAEGALLLKAFPPTGETWRGPSLWFYRLVAPQYSSDVVWNQTLHLVGYDLKSSETTGDAAPGDTLTFTGYWQADTSLTTDLRLFVHVRPLDDLTQVVAQADGRPLADRPSPTWTDAQETLIGTPYSVTLPADLPSGRYALIIGLYESETGTRWRTQAGEDGLTLMTLTLKN